jgi:glyoxylase-like metal-dependent hydrolase (beta-lactamase superfamily II)
MTAAPAAQAGVDTVRAFFHAPTSSVSYVLQDASSEHCVVIDPVLDYEPGAARTGTQFADRMLEYIRGNQLRVDWILETHAHADHLTAAQYLHKQLGAPVGIGEYIEQVQKSMKPLFNLPDAFACDGSQFDHLFADGERIKVGTMQIQVMHTPGHTPACVSYLSDGVAFVGDTLFMPDYGTARADFPGGSASALYRSIRRLLSLPDATRLYCCHDYPPAGREPQWQATVMQQKRSNIHVRSGIDERGFVQMREARDKTLALPGLILPALQVNMRAGHLPEPESNGVRYLRIPLDVFR